MSAERNKAFIRNYLADISGRSKPRELICSYTDDESLITHILSTERAFPEYRLEPEEIVAEGDLVSVRARMTGVNRGEIHGAPATGREVTITVFVTYRIANGRIVEHWMLADNAELMRQLGLLGGPNS